MIYVIGVLCGISVFAAGFVVGGMTMAREYKLALGQIGVKF